MVTTPAHLRSIVNQDGAVILDIPANQMTTLNATGGYIWERLQGGQSVEQISSSLAEDTGHDPLIVENEVREFLKQLTERHLLSA